jgi:adenosylmethionine-8-amino-7-oxononanoate aminotransferase
MAGSMTGMNFYHDHMDYILGFAPPLVMTIAEVDEMVAIAEASVKQILDELVKAG